MQEIITYTVSEIVSLDDLKPALILNAINSKIGGVLFAHRRKSASENHRDHTSGAKANLAGSRFVMQNKNKKT
jgi:Mg-chelatase subunit ChlI